MHPDEATGQVLACTGSAESTVTFPGFTYAQNDEVEALARNLGADRLSEADQDRIQQRIDDIVATVPSSARPHHDEGVSLGPLWGAGLAWAGGAVLIVGLVGAVVLVRRS
ncbi:hypothetical protein [Amycolatopsis sp. NPDC051903]|uniref:hypothetical protein n=1 Tax=Amycolatopsis sp. NPDC051903 TaxID=3363936 RepID=UPI0037AE5B5A